MKYYFITYQATNRDGNTSIWNDTINVSPMKFIKHIEGVEENGSRTYYDFLITNTLEISEDEYNEWNGHFG